MNDSNDRFSTSADDRGSARPSSGVESTDDRDDQLVAEAGEDELELGDESGARTLNESGADKSLTTRGTRNSKHKHVTLVKEGAGNIGLGLRGMFSTGGRKVSHGLTSAGTKMSQTLRRVKDSMAGKNQKRKEKKATLQARKGEKMLSKATAKLQGYGIDYQPPSPSSRWRGDDARSVANKENVPPFSSELGGTDMSSTRSSYSPSPLRVGNEGRTGIDKSAERETSSKKEHKTKGGVFRGIKRRLGFSKSDEPKSKKAKMEMSSSQKRTSEKLTRRELEDRVLDLETKVSDLKEEVVEVRRSSKTLAIDEQRTSADRTSSGIQRTSLTSRVSAPSESKADEVRESQRRGSTGSITK